MIRSSRRDPSEAADLFEPAVIHGNLFQALHFLRTNSNRPTAFPLIEAVGLLQMALLAAMFAWRPPPMPLGGILLSTLNHAVSGVLMVLIGLAGRSAWEAWKGRLAGYWKIVASWKWLGLTARLTLLHYIVSSVYSILKLLIPFYHHASFDSRLWELDRALFFGYSPNSLFLELFRQPMLLRLVDFIYADIFFAFLMVSFPFFISHPSDARRHAFFLGNAVLWFTGLCLYLLVPSIGPIYRFPEVFRGTDTLFPHSRILQTALIKNYTALEKVLAGVAPADLKLDFGIAAFPSLHVGLESYVALWIRGDSRVANRLAWGLSMVTFIGSVVTGWHYLVDALAGLMLAFLCYYFARFWESKLAGSDRSAIEPGSQPADGKEIITLP